MCLQEHASQQVHVLEERLVELQAQLAAAQQTAGKADAGSKQLMLDKEQQVSACQWQPSKKLSVPRAAPRGA